MNEREAFKQGHPPACTCVSCSDKRARRLQSMGLWRRFASLFRPRRR